MLELTFRQESVNIPIWIRSFKETHGITMCCVIMNEEKEIKEFLEYHRPYMDKIIIMDGGSTDRTIEIASPLADEIHMHRFDGHYSNQANRILERVKTDWAFIIDCDERIEMHTLKNLRNLIDQDEVDCWSFPRRNFINGVLDSTHYPDYQDRLYRSYCRRVRPVHGEVVGFKNKKQLPCTEGNFIIHSKTMERHTLRNQGYLLFEEKFKHELGEPGSQMEGSFYKRYPKLHESNFRLDMKSR